MHGGEAATTLQTRSHTAVNYELAGEGFPKDTPWGRRDIPVLPCNLWGLNASPSPIQMQHVDAVGQCLIETH